MRTQHEIPWTISPAEDWTRPHHAGAASSAERAWLAALAAGRAALLAGELADLAVAVDDPQPTALYHPGRDADGRLDPSAVTAALLEIYQGATAAGVAAAITGETPADGEPAEPKR
jgi:hypothetical protein